MSRRRQPARARAERLLVFGEHRNDRESLKNLIEALCPGARGRVAVVREPLVLIKDRAPKDAASQAEKIAKVISAMNVRFAVVCTFLHEDLDDVEPKHVALCQQIEDALRATDCPGDVHAVVPAWETEAWWFLWPDVLPLVNKVWSLPQRYSKGGVGKIRDAKEVLARELVRGRGRGAEKHRYRESDSIRISKKIADLGQANQPARGRSLSYDRFRDCVSRCCESLS